MIEEKIDRLKERFTSCTSQEEIYQTIMAMGKELSPLDAAYKTDEHLVPGCQSLMYLHTEERDGALHFSAASDALISAGLAAILLNIYSGETPEVILKTPPKFLEELAIPTTLSPGRANGLAGLYLRIKREAIAAFAQVKL